MTKSICLLDSSYPDQTNLATSPIAQHGESGNWSSHTESNPLDRRSAVHSESAESLQLASGRELSTQTLAKIPATRDTEGSQALVESGQKFVPLALCISDKVYQISFLQQASMEDDRTIMQRIQDKYWDIRGKWKKYFHGKGIWLGTKLRRLGPVQVGSLDQSISI